MQTVTLYIESYDGAKTVALDEEISIGRTNAATIVLGDGGLSRLNTTFFRDEDLVFVVDENSTNGTFVNGGRISGPPRQIFDGDRIKIGTETNIRIAIGEKAPSPERELPKTESKPATSPSISNQSAPTAAIPQPASRSPQTEKPPIILFAAVGSMLLIAFLGIAAYVIVSRYETIASNSRVKATTKISASAAIPIRVVDPLGSGELDDLDELIEAWEVQDAAFEAKDLQAVSVSVDAPQLTVSVADWEKQRNLAMGRRNAPTGLVSGVSIPPELQGNIGKQLAQFAKMGLTRDKLPKDFVSLAQKRMNNELVELPLATEIYFLDNIGTSVDASPFNVFDINTNGKSPLAPNSEGMTILQKLAANYNGQKYDINTPSDRVQMKRRLLRMFHPDAKVVLEEIAGAYQKQFKRPLKITSLTRSLEYQVDLSRATSNAYRGATPPHSTGRTFDIAYMHMTAEEQNFIMAKFAELEKAGRVDALHERGQTPCIHTFVFPKQ